MLGTMVYEGFSAKLLFTSTRKPVKLVISVGGSGGLEFYMMNGHIHHGGEECRNHKGI
jgi:hypothetical protein